MECRDSKILPYPGSILAQTVFTRDLFSFLDSVVAEHKEREAKKQEEEMKKK